MCLYQPKIINLPRMGFDSCASEQPWIFLEGFNDTYCTNAQSHEAIVGARIDIKLSPPYLPQVSGVPDHSRLQFFQHQGDSLKRANPGSLRDPLSCTDSVTQTRNCAGAQTHLHTEVKTTWHQQLQSAKDETCVVCSVEEFTYKL